MLLRSLVGSLALSTLAITTPAVLATPVSAHADARSEERVLRDDVALTVRADGVVHAKETIAYEFAGSRGIERSFVTRTRQDDTRDRIFKVENVKASSPDGGPATTSVTRDGDRTIVKVSGGGAITGRRTIALEYDVLGGIAQIGGIQELRWTAVSGWGVEVVSAKATVEADSAMRNLNCFAGALGSAVGCTQVFTNHTQTRGEFTQRNMLPQETMTVVVGYPVGKTTKSAPLYEQRRTLATAFTVNAITGGALLGLLVLLLGGVALLYQLRGRDARIVSRKAAEGDHTPVNGMSFEPPSGVRPGQIGTLIDEQADVIDVTATIVDLAVRGYLLVEEDTRDWTLRKLDRPVDDLFPYERTLFDALFSGRDTVRLGELGGTFATDLAEVRGALYDDVVRQGWFVRRPDSVRTRWTLAGLILTAVGVVGTVALALFTELGLIGLAAIIAGAALAIGGQYMPAKTTRGATVLAHTLGFRAYLARGEASDVESRQRIAMFSRYLPYAIVFDNVHKWAKTVEDAGVRTEGADNLYWYEGPAEWDLSRFADSMRTFTLATSGAISQTRQFRSLT
ncbi:DUF2207 domain-containing protein [Actinomadura sp. HBU206391]|uniref:DUF2207 domain-containing protein n=1 Tax=Actinomadura sp. HBU206391 TaxID=2731692 RepID=UPI00164F62FB|nr:DUF2207 domain-containing protein [Actinomadura sp. HBU206391]MBC6460353.1 DUF2207 domain-containing protein [Actinomadura sp. HBU206391]